MSISNHRLLIALLVGGIGLAFSGCRTAGNFGQMMSQHGQAAKDLGNDWTKGDAMVRKGNKLQEQSESYAVKSQRRADESAKLIEEGTALMQNSEKAFDSQVGNIR